MTEEVVQHRARLLTGIVRLLLTIIPARRGYKMKETRAVYHAGESSLLDDPPLP